MKTLVSTYTFDASAKTITLGDYISIDLNRVLLVTNVTDNIIIYNFADTAKGGSVATNVLTLDYDTTSMDDSDKLQIFYDDADAVQKVSAATLPLPTNAATSAKQDTGNTSLSSIDGKITAVNTGAVVVSSSALPSGAATAANQVTTNGHLDGVEGLLTTIDADTGNISTKIDTLAGAVSGTEMQVDVLTMPIVAVTQSGTWDEVGINDSGNSITVDNAQLSVIGTGTEATALRVTVASDSTGVLSVDDNGSSLTVDGTVTANAGTNLNTSALALETTATSIKTAVEAIQAGQLPDSHNVTVDNASLAVTGTFWQATQPVSGTVTANLSATDNTVLDNIDTNTAGILLDTAAIQTAVETIDNAISGNEMQVDIVGALPAGTNAIGKLLPPDIDVTTHTNYAKKYYTNAGAATDGIVWSPAAGKRWHVVTLYINVSAASTVTLEDDLAAGDAAVWKGELAANSGVVINFGEKYPLASGEDAADLLVTTTAGNVYITCVGYEI